jgi:hypothetical protein
MNKELIEQKELSEEIAIVTANQGTPTGMGLPLTDEYIGYVIKLCEKYWLDKVVEAVDKTEGAFYVSTPDSISRGEAIHAINKLRNTGE